MTRKLIWILSFLFLAPAAHAQPSAPPAIYDTFNHPDGTLIGGVVAMSGNTVWEDNLNGWSGNGVIKKGVLNNTGNTYSSFPNTATPGGSLIPIKSFGGTFKILAANAGMPMALIADLANGTGGLSNMIHINLGQTRADATFSATGYSAFTPLAGQSYAPLIVGASYSVSMDFDSVANKVTIHWPDGTTSTVAIPASISSLYYARYQLGGYSTPGVAVWTYAWSGQNTAERFVASGGAAPMVDVTKLNQMNNQISGAKSNLPLGSPTLFATFLMPGAQSGDRLMVSTQTLVESGALPGVAMDIEDVEIPIFSAACCNQMGSVKVINSNPQNTSGVCFSAPITASISGTPGSAYTVSLYSTPSVYGGCPNNGYITGARLNYTVKAQGDSGGVLSAQ